MHAEHAGGCERAVQGFFARLPRSSRVTRTHCAPPGRALLRAKGFCGASGEATACGPNLYEDMAAACEQKEAASNSCTVRNGRKSQNVVSPASRPGVFQIALFKGFSDIPHIPLPPEHSVGRNEATRSPTRENPESWQDSRRPREILLDAGKWEVYGESVTPYTP